MADRYIPEAAVARVELVEDQTVYLRFAGGNVLPLRPDEDEVEDLAVGDVVLVDMRSFDVTKAPKSLWPGLAVEKSWIGTVAAMLDDGRVIVDVLGRFFPFPVKPGLSVAVGNTVEGTEAAGVEKVLFKTPVEHPEPQGSGNLASHYRLTPAGAPTYDDFGGYSTVKERIKELIELPLNHRDKLLQIKAPFTRGVLFTGPSGTGKTMLGRIIAGHAKATLYLVSGPEIVGKWLGDSEKLVRDIFDDAKNNQPAIVFFDEIDSVAPQRSDESHEATRRLVGQLLTSMDGYDQQINVMVIATTNRPEDIDIALRRPGRFDWQIEFTLPDRDDREDILRKSSRKLHASGELPHAVIADRTEGWTSAELTGIWREAALFAVKDDRSVLMSEDYFAGYELAANQRDVVARSQKNQPSPKESL